MRELESSLQQFGEFLLKAHVARPAAAPYFVRWVRRFLDDAARQQGVPQPRVAPELVRDYLAHLAVHQQVSAGTHNQACCAILFLCREVLGVTVESLSPGVRARRGERLPVVLSMPETMALLGAMSGTPRLMATLIYGGGLRVTECCELRFEDLDFDQGLDVVRRGKGDKDRATLLAEVGRDELRACTCASQRRSTRSTAGRDLLVCGYRMLWIVSTRMPAASLRGSGCFPAGRCPPIPERGSSAGIT